jgi:sulfur-oxidizing protein SoxX
MASMQQIVLLILMTLVPHSSGAQGIHSQDEGLGIIVQKQLGNCVACHEIPGVQHANSNLGPSLKGVGARLTRETLTHWVKDARTLQPNTLMPPFGSTAGLKKLSHQQPLLTDAQIQKVVETLLTWQSFQ